MRTLPGRFAIILMTLSGLATFEGGRIASAQIRLTDGTACCRAASTAGQSCATITDITFYRARQDGCNLYTDYSVASSSGDARDLTGDFREVLSYGPRPNPPFEQGPGPNASWNIAAGRFSDDHIMVGVMRGPAATWTVDQLYVYTPTGGCAPDQTFNAGRIVREVFAESGTWKYRVTKGSATMTCNLPSP